MKILCGKGYIFIAWEKNKNKIFGIAGFHIFLFQNPCDRHSLVTSREKVIEVGEGSVL